MTLFEQDLNLLVMSAVTSILFDQPQILKHTIMFLSVMYNFCDLATNCKAAVTLTFYKN